jgi:hypothetical protein
VGIYSPDSRHASVAFPAYLLGQNPSAQIICASYAQDLSDKHARDTRALMNSAFYQDLFTTRMSSIKQAVGEFITTAGGGRLATSVGGVLAEEQISSSSMIQSSLMTLFQNHSVAQPIAGTTIPLSAGSTISEPAASLSLCSDYTKMIWSGM